MAESICTSLGYLEEDHRETESVRSRGYVCGGIVACYGLRHSDSSPHNRTNTGAHNSSSRRPDRSPETSEPAAAPQLLPEVNPLEVTGDIVTARSSTVFPAERMAERFQDEGYAGNITIDSIGSGGGYERFCVTGETDIANASRAIKDEEVASCEAIGRTPIEFRVGTDALAVVVNKDNDFVTDVTKEELAAIFSDAATKWSDVRAEWPAEDILRFIPGTDSGTFDYFVEEIFDEDETPHLSAANTQLSEDDNVLVQGVLGSPYAIGYFGYAYYAENADAQRPLHRERCTHRER